MDYDVIDIAEQTGTSASWREMICVSSKEPIWETYVYILVMSGHSARCPEKRGLKEWFSRRRM